jgi:hypothetical protein
MKKLFQPVLYKYAALLFILNLVTAIVWAQDSTSTSKSTTTSTTTTTETWYAQPWVWIVGAAVLIIIIVALTRGGGGSSSVAGTTDKTTVTRTHTTDVN